MSEDRVAARAAALLGVEDEADTDVAEQPEDTAAAEVPQETVEELKFDIDPEVPEEILELLDTPDFDAEAEAEVEAEVEDDDDDEYDPEKAELRRKLKAAEKKAAHFEKLRLDKERKAWAEEAEKFFPLSDPGKIEATSRRGFLRAAKAEHEALKPKFQAFVESERRKIEAAAEQAKAEAKAEAKEAWGTPFTGPGAAPVRAAEQAEKLAEVRKRGNLVETVKAMFDASESAATH